jgi:ATP-dependent Clp protease ATP-binding subunit ClpA
VFSRFDDEARAAIALGIQEARSQETSVGPEHLLVGVAEHPGRLLSPLLAGTGITASGVRSQLVAGVVDAPASPSPAPRATFSPSGKQALEFALRLAQRMDDEQLSGSHLLWGVLATLRGQSDPPVTVPDAVGLMTAIEQALSSR